MNWWINRPRRSRLSIEVEGGMGQAFLALLWKGVVLVESEVMML